VARCFFHVLASFRGKKPPCWAVWRCGIGAALHVIYIFCEFFCIMMSIELQAFCHWVFVR
jgi:hypothetical protein